MVFALYKTYRSKYCYRFGTAEVIIPVMTRDQHFRSCFRFDTAISERSGQPHNLVFVLETIKMAYNKTSSLLDVQGLRSP